MNYRIEKNEEFNSLEVYFDDKPSGDIMDALKALKMRWHNAKKCWYGRVDRAAITKAVETGAVDVEKITISGQTKTLSKKVEYFKNVSDYITLEEFRASLYKSYDNNYYKHDLENIVNHYCKEYYNSNNEYQNISRYIRQAIIWKSLGYEADKFRANGNEALYVAVWDKLPTIEGLKPSGKKYSAMWGYDQTQITTAIHYGKVFGLDLLITGGYGSGEVLLKRISKNETFEDGCKYFSLNKFTEKEIDSINEYVAYNGR